MYILIILQFNQSIFWLNCKITEVCFDYLKILFIFAVVILFKKYNYASNNNTPKPSLERRKIQLIAISFHCGKSFSKIYITGSNSDLLQNKFATLLSGRYFANTVRPLSLREIFQINGINDRYAALSRRIDVLTQLANFSLQNSPKQPKSSRGEFLTG